MRWIASTLASLHRLFLVLSSIALGVVGSRVASDPREWPSWALLVGFGALMFAADVGRRADDKGQTVAVATSTPVAIARRDVLTKFERIAIPMSGLIAIVAILAAVLLATVF